MSANNEIWKHFTKTRCNTKVRCNYCTQYLVNAYDIPTRCKRHLFKRHPSVFDGKVYGTYDPNEKRLLEEQKARVLKMKSMLQHVKLTSSETWEHYSKLACSTKARCKHCNKDIQYSEGSASNLKRHLFRQHAAILLNETDLSEPNFSEPMDGEILEEEEIDAGSFVASFNPSMPNSDDASNVKEVQFIKNPYLTEPIRVEIQTVSPDHHNSSVGENATDGTINETEMLTGDGYITSKTEELIASEDYLPGEETSKPATPEGDRNEIHIEYFSLSAGDSEFFEPMENEHRTSDHAEQHSGRKQPKMSESKHATIGKSSISPRAKAFRKELSGLGALTDARNIDVRTTVYATNIALELEGLDSRQKTIAEKLISDVIFHARLEALTENAIVMGRVSTFEQEL